MKIIMLVCGAAVLCVLPAQGQTVRGTIVEDSSRTPIKGATVELVGTNSVNAGTILSDSLGAFVLRVHAPGKYLLQLSHPSYTTSSDSVTLASGEVLILQLRMGRQAIPLAPIVVTSRGNARLGGFYDRMQRGGFGYYMPRSEIEKRPGASRATDLLQSVPGVELIPIRRGRGASMANLISMRGGGRRCPPAIFINGAPVRQVGESGVDDFLTPNALEAIEVYRSSAGTPAQFQLPNTCGAVAFWTRTGEEDDLAKFNWKRVVLTGGFIAAVALLVGIVN